jgi:hypothetical protein
VSPEVEESGVKYSPSVLERPGQELRYMRRRRVDRTDRNGDPLDGVINLFNVAVVLALGLLIAALSSMGLTGILSSGDMTLVTNPGKADMTVLIKQGDHFTRLVLQPGQQYSGVGTPIGQFYQLADGSTIYVPASGSTLPTALPSASATTPGVLPSTTPSTTPTYVPTTPTYTPPPTYGPTETPPPGVPTTPPPHKISTPPGP